MKFGIALGMAVAAASVMTTPTFAETQWDLPLAWPAENYITKNVQQFADIVKEATNGDVVITLHPGGSLGYKGPEMLSAVRDGLVPIGDMLMNQQVGDAPLLGLTSLPYLISSFEELKEFDVIYRSLLTEVMAEHNQIPLFTIPWPQQQIYTKVEIKTIADLSGIKIRSYDASSTKIFEAASMTAVQLPWGDVIPSLATGAIDAVATSAPSAVDGSFWEFLKYGYPTRQTWNTNVVSVNKDAWDGLSKESQDVILKIAGEQEAVFWQSAMDEDAKNMTILAQNNMVNGEIDDAMREELRNRAAPLREEALKALGDRAVAVVEAFQSR